MNNDVFETMPVPKAYFKMALPVVFWVFAINHVSTILYTRLMTMPNTTGRAILK